MKQQTAIDWLVDELSKYTIYNPTSLSDWQTLKKLSKQAKSIEKEQIINSYVDGQSSVMNFGVYQQAEKHYNETYNK